jgi:lantibiotic modifying enzyme
MLALSDLLDDPSLLASAEAYGDELIDRAEESSDGWSWASPGNPTSRNLTGFSHGVAGIAVALLELHRATGARRFADAAARGLDYERATFSPDVGNWPDFREHAGGSRQRSFAAFWCHGAPGIGLSRLRAAELGLGNGNGAGDETRAALATTRAFVDRDLAHGRANLSLCHGLCGNAEILAEAGDQGPANAVARHGRHAYEPDGSWPCGMPTGQTPSLMVGLAGIGHFYLRRSDPRVPSVLLIRREQWAAATA